LRLASNDVPGALADQAASLARAREVQDPQAVIPVLVHSAHVLAITGDVVAATQLYDELLSHDKTTVDMMSVEFVDLADTGDLIGRREELASWLGRIAPSPWIEAGRALLDDDYDTALQILIARNAHRCVALVRLRAAQAGARTGSPANWTEHLHEALALFRAQGAVRYVREAEALLPATA
jgi:hypothetical protein